MGFDSGGTYQYKSLEEKYKGFLAPDFEIHVGSMTINSHNVPVSFLEVKMTLEGAGYAKFSVESLYDYEASDWVSRLIADIHIGDLVKVSVGYCTRNTRIFLGYVDSYTVNFRQESSPSVTIVAMDAITVLNCDRRVISFADQEASQMIKKMIQDSGVGSIIEKISVDTIPVQMKLVEKKNISRGTILNALAKRLFYSYCVINGELLMKNLMSNTSPLLSLTMGLDLKTFEKTVNIKSRMVKSVDVRGTDDNKKVVSAEASSLEGSSGDDPTKVQQLVNAKLSLNIGDAKTVDDCQNYAKKILSSLSLGFLEADAETIGYPEMTPGRYIKIGGLDRRSNGSYFVTEVIHSFGPDGYINKIHMKGYNEKR